MGYYDPQALQWLGPSTAAQHQAVAGELGRVFGEDSRAMSEFVFLKTGRMRLPELNFTECNLYYCLLKEMQPQIMPVLGLDEGDRL